ncbi:polyphosphate kinase [Rhodocytophaga aerolata]|uniref:Polyphosphate kinase n=1 Tax=Rhodocytophaga aerolata TaxID=455078 RepID=A0ABT8REQ0_9BACT|nr:PPK2 family polyphosphate kinase [Rhodocytophaga aerolata]MDO1450601.1 polyphosphate kinase [Rhodocytophaga aerolata]
MKLATIQTKAPSSLDKETIREKTQDLLNDLKELQDVFYALKKNSLLVVLQGLDASGKDGAIKKVFTGVNPMGCTVKPFKVPTADEASHDFLWRVHQHTPAKGMIQIFNRSHYEDVLVPRVEKFVNRTTIKKRYDHINNFEQLLTDSGTIILKFFLYVSEEEQLKRIQERITNPKKHWKYDPSDLTTTQKRDLYLEAYEEIFEHCGPNLPWTIVPSDQNWYKEYVIAKTIVETLKNLDLHYPGKQH